MGKQRRKFETGFEEPSTDLGNFKVAVITRSKRSTFTKASFEGRTSLTRQIEVERFGKRDLIVCRQIPAFPCHISSQMFFCAPDVFRIERRDGVPHNTIDASEGFFGAQEPAFEFPIGQHY